MISEPLFCTAEYAPYHNIADRLWSAGYQAYFVGGCVRDALRGVAPHDIDIATSALPEEVARVFDDFTVLKTGLQHGTVTLLLPPDSGGVRHQCEITTFRTESGYSDNRRPDSVTFVSDLHEDLSRRDFTVNALAYYPKVGLVDDFCGIDDLQRGIIRAVGAPHERFCEDGLRILRALRFSAKLGFEIEPATSDSVIADRQLLRNISAERIAAELDEILLYDTASNILSKYRDVFAVFIPELIPTFDFDQRNRHHRYDLYRHTLRTLDNLPPVLELRLTGLLHDLAKPATQTIDDSGQAHYYGHAEAGAHLADRILRRLKYSTAIREKVVTLIAAHMTPPPVGARSARRMLNKYGEKTCFDILTFMRADMIACGDGIHDDDLSKTDSARACLQAELDAQQCFSISSLAVNGHDMLDLGIPKGVAIGKMLNKLLDLVIDGAVPNEREALLAIARKELEAQ